ncbi:TPA: ATP-dependent nuclease [Clostridium perfringens]|uniref:ATP-dependent nuclease n=1 Tax=Clostridium perfringens TaxID=1502 RepID=UPI0010946239|nr:AAA family ATPase [Clostridium perfringens]TGY47630.1 hypothetical protein E5346_01100 [Clostridium perfringens]
MREAKVKDIWRNLYKSNKYKYKIQNIELKGIVNGTFEAYSGVSAICGLNGVGKSTIMLSIKDALGINMKKLESNKIENQKVKLKIEKDGEEFYVENEDGKRLSDILEINSSVYYLDYELAIKASEYLMQDNLQELLDQYEEVPFNEKELEEISYIVGKRYTKCIVTEIYDENEQGEDECTEINIPFFKVQSQGIEYNSLTMGLGESILFYFYWFFRSISESSIVIFEEPEAFLNIKSQQNLMNLICERCSKVGINIIVSTHSPYLINRVREDKIYVLSKFNTYTELNNSESKHGALINLGMYLPKRGIFYVEDEAAKYFFTILLSKNRSEIKKVFDIEVVNGEGNITERLKFPRSNEFSYTLIGVYDGDMREKINDPKINWQYVFLPGDKPIEIEFRKIVNKNLDKFISKVNQSSRIIIQILQKYDGENYHDWFTNVAKDLGYNIESFIRVFYDLWIEEEENKLLVSKFFDELAVVLENT